LADRIIVIGRQYPSAVGPAELMEDFGKRDFVIKDEAEASPSHLRGLIVSKRRNNREYYWVTHVLILGG
jgi:hypothetical protein